MRKRMEKKKEKEENTWRKETIGWRIFGALEEKKNRERKGGKYLEKKNIFLEEKKIGKGKGGKYFLGTTSLSIILSQSQSNQVYETAVSQFVTDKGRLDN